MVLENFFVPPPIQPKYRISPNKQHPSNRDGDDDDSHIWFSHIGCQFLFAKNRYGNFSTIIQSSPVADLQYKQQTDCHEKQQFICKLLWSSLRQPREKKKAKHNRRRRHIDRHCRRRFSTFWPVLWLICFNPTISKAISAFPCIFVLTARYE